jgi:diguanylate cyclase (GGDEF)-like protein/PAS domain S-box-containing protein
MPPKQGARAVKAPARERQRIRQIRELTERLRASEAFLDRTGRVAGVGGWELSLRSGKLRWTTETCRIHDLEPGHAPTVDEALAYYADGARSVMEAAVKHAIEAGEEWDLELPMVTATGRHIWVRAQGMVEKRGDRPYRLVGAFQDITERRQAIDALLASERRYRKLFAYSLGLICTHDMDGYLLSVNPAACESLGYTELELVGRHLQEFVRDRHRSAFAAYISRITTRGSDAGHLQLVASDGSRRIWHYQNVVDVEGGESYVLGHAQDITEQQRHEKRLRDWSMRDALTGCYNRRFLAEQLDEDGADRVWSCIVIDLDRFKYINDTFGHQRGDEVLVGMARFLASHLGDNDCLVRMGGDEFLILMRGQSIGDAERLAATLAAHRGNAVNPFTLGCAAHTPGQPVQATFSLADKALYALRSEQRGAPA